LNGNRIVGILPQYCTRARQEFPAESEIEMHRLVVVRELPLTLVAPTRKGQVRIETGLCRC
jgi:hypothetical protein